MEKPNDTGISETLDHHHLHLHLHQPNKNSNSDPDPGASNSRAPPPPPVPQPTTPAQDSAIVVLYRECLKNHAANMGSHVVDGCGEFMPSGEEGTPEALKCAACECHRSFHRREDNGEAPARGNCYQPYNQNHHNVQRRTTYQAQAQAEARARAQTHLPPPHLYRAPSQPIMMAFGGSRGPPEESSSEDLNMFHSNNAEAQPGAQPSFSEPKKRFRTKFSREQKDRMQQLAEKLGWKMQKQDDEEVQQFCNEFGIKRQVFKVWMHNNKQAMKKKQL